MKHTLLLILILTAFNVFARPAVVMWLDTRSPESDQQRITTYIKTQFNDNVTIDLNNLAVWHSASNYGITGWVLSSDYKKIVDHGIDIQELIQKGIPSATSNLLNPEYLKWFVASNNAVQTLNANGYIAPTNTPVIK